MSTNISDNVDGGRKPGPLVWSPPGPVAARFMQSMAPVPLINGPIGSGKTGAALVKGVVLGGLQRPSTKDGVRKFKFCVIRDTYRQLWKATIPSWHTWVGKKVGHWSGGKDGPARHEIVFPQPDGTFLEYTVDFVAIGENSAESVMRGYEPTAFLLEEMDLLAEEVFTFAVGRTGRFPSMAEGGASWHGTVGTYNAPELDTWLHETVLDPPEGVEVFRQPGAREPGAENVHNLVPGYYENQIKLNARKPNYIKRFIDNEPGYSSAGKAVYHNFSDNRHVSKENLVYHPGLRLELGLDAGLTPACLFVQVMPNGQKRVIDELVPGRAGPTEFSRLLVDKIKRDFPEADWDEGILGHCDPSAVDGGDGEDVCWLDKVRSETGLKIRPAVSNTLAARLDPMHEILLRNIDGVEPEFLVSPKCKMYRKGLNGGYRFAKITGSNSRFRDIPEKNEYSHIHDGGQYVFMSVKGSVAVSNSIRRRRKDQGLQKTAILKTESTDMRGHNSGNVNQRLARM